MSPNDRAAAIRLLAQPRSLALSFFPPHLHFRNLKQFGNPLQVRPAIERMQRFGELLDHGELIVGKGKRRHGGVLVFRQQVDQRPAGLRHVAADVVPDYHRVNNLDSF